MQNCPLKYNIGDTVFHGNLKEIYKSVIHSIVMIESKSGVEYKYRIFSPFNEDFVNFDEKDIANNIEEMHKILEERLEGLREKIKDIKVIEMPNLEETKK
jgi:hypothetical protein